MRFQFYIYILLICFLNLEQVLGQTFEQCNGKEDCIKSCQNDPTQPICQSTTTSSYPGCEGNTACQKECEMDPSQDFCKTTSSTTGMHPGCDPNDSTCINECNEKPTLEQCKNSTTSTSSGSTSPTLDRLNLQQQLPRHKQIPHQKNQVTLMTGLILHPQ